MTTRAALGLVEAVPFSEATRLATGRGKAAVFAVLHRRLADPVHARIAADSLVGRVDKNNLVVLIGGVLVDPVRVQDAQIHATTSDALFGDRLQIAAGLQVVHTMARRLAADLALADLALAATTADTDAVDDEALLGLVAHATSLVRAGRTRSAVDNV